MPMPTLPMLLLLHWPPLPSFSLGELQSETEFCNSHDGRAGEHQRTCSGDIIPYTRYSVSPEGCLWLNLALPCSEWSRQQSTSTKWSLFLGHGKMYPSDFSEQVYLTSHFSQLLEKIEMQKEIPLRRERQANTMELTQYGSGKILFRLELVKARSLRKASVLIAQQYHKVDLGRTARCLGLLKRHFFLLSLSLRHCLSFTHTQVRSVTEYFLHIRISASKKSLKWCFMKLSLSVPPERQEIGVLVISQLTCSLFTSVRGMHSLRLEMWISSWKGELPWWIGQLPQWYINLNLPTHLCRVNRIFRIYFWDWVS